MANKQINAILALQDKFSTPLFKVSDNVKTVTKDIEGQVARANRTARKMENRMDRMVKSAFKWAKRLAIVGGGLSLKVGWEGLKELDDGARKVKSIAKDALKLQDIKDGLLKTSSKVGVDVKDVAEGQYMAISSSVDPKESLKYAELAVKVQKAGFTDSKNAIDLITSIQNAYGESGIKNAYKLADQLLHTQNRGKIEVGEMTQYYGKLIPLFSQAGVGYEEMNAGMATLTKMGMKPAEASTALAGAIRIMMKPTKQTNAALDGLGVKFGAAQLKAKGFGGLMAEVMKATGGDMAKITRIFPNARAMLAGAALTGKEGMREYQNILKELQGEEITGSLEEAFEVIQGSVGNQWEKLKQNMKNTNTKFYMQYEGNLAEKLKEINEWFENNPEKIEAMLERIGDAIVWVIEAGEKFFKFVQRNKKALKAIGKTIMIIYGGLKAMRGITKIAETVSNFVDLINIASLTGVGKAIIGVGLALYGIFKIAKKIYDIRRKLKKFGEDTPAGLPRDLQGPEVDESQYGVPGLEESMAGLTEMERNIYRVWHYVSRFLKLLKHAKDVTSDLILMFTGIESPIAQILAIIWPELILVKWAFDAIKKNASGLLDGLATFFEGMEKALNADSFGEAFGGLKEAFSGVVKFISGLWGTLVDFVTSPIDAFVNFLDNQFGDKVGDVVEAWEKTKDTLKHPIKSIVQVVWPDKKEVPEGMPKELKGPEYDPSNYGPLTDKEEWKQLTKTQKFFKGIVKIVKTIKDTIGEIIGVTSDLILMFTGIESPIGQILVLLKPELILVKWALDAVKGNVDGLKESFEKFFGGWKKMSEANNIVEFFSGAKESIEGIKTFIHTRWKILVDFVTSPIDAIVNFIDNKFGEKAAGVIEWWRKVKEALKNPVSAIVEFFGPTDKTKTAGPLRDQAAGSAGKLGRKRRMSSRADNGIYSRYTGDMSWKGGIVQVHEKGGEILDLPSGTRIFPHDRSVRMAYEEGKNSATGQGGNPIILNFYGDLYGEEDYIDKVGKGITERLIAELDNM